MAGLRLLPLGIGNAFSAVSYSTCLALEADGCWLLIDCPHPIRKMMREASASAAVDLDAAAVHAVVLTHLHADHVSGLEGLAYYHRFFLNRKLRLVAHPTFPNIFGAGTWPPACSGRSRNGRRKSKITSRTILICTIWRSSKRFPSGRLRFPFTRRHTRCPRWRSLWKQRAAIRLQCRYGLRSAVDRVAIAGRLDRPRGQRRFSPHALPTAGRAAH